MGTGRSKARLSPTIDTMLPRALLVLLAVMNLAVALWWMTHAAVPVTAPAQERPPGVPALRLLSEGGPAAAPPPEVRCYRFGPYSDTAMLEAAREAAGDIAPRVDAITIPGPAPTAWRVAAAPPADGDTAALATRIVAAGFGDTVVVAEGPETGSVALGRFSTVDAAERHRAALQAAGFDAQVHPVGGNSDWLRLPLPGTPDLLDMRGALAALQALPTDCAG